MALRSSSILSAGASAGGTTRRPARRRSAMVGPSGSLGWDGRLGRLVLGFGRRRRLLELAVGLGDLWLGGRELHSLAAIAALLGSGLGRGFGHRRRLRCDAIEGPGIGRLL